MKVERLTMLLALFTIGLNLMSQERTKEKANSENEIRLNEMKALYIQAKLDLSESKLEAFTKLYNQYEMDKDKLKKDARKERRAMNTKRRMTSEEIDALKEEEAMKLLHAKLKQQEALLRLEKSYLEQFTSSISAKQVLQYQQAEKDFKRDLLKMVMEERKNSEDYNKRLNEKMKGHMKEMREMRRIRQMKHAKELKE